MLNYKLNYVRDSVADNNGYTADLKSQRANNYAYDSIGNLTADVRDSIVNISWNVYGKIDSITKQNGTGIKYAYDAAGNRISKTVTPSAEGLPTVNIRTIPLP